MFINCIMIENAYHGSVGGMATNTYGRVDQLEDRYLGMVEAPSSNLGTSTFEKQLTESRLRVSQNRNFLFFDHV